MIKKKLSTIIKTNSSNRVLLLSHIDSANGQGIISVEFESPKDFKGKYEYFNVVITVFALHKGYLKSLYKNHQATIKYKKEELPQVNPQLYEWLRTINARHSGDKSSQPPTGWGDVNRSIMNRITATQFA